LGDIGIRGYEEHPDDLPGKPGFFVDKDDSVILDIVALPMPDCYEVKDKGFLRVPDLKTSLFLRSKGASFKCRCIKFDEEFWDVAEKIPEVEVNAS
jgi:hypothetical protein